MFKITNKEKLEAVMSEYKIIRQELWETVSNQLKIYTFALSAISIVFGYLLLNGCYDSLVLLPFVTIVLAYRFSWDIQMSMSYSQYLSEMEEQKIPRIIGYFIKDKETNDHLKYWIGWEHFYEETKAERTRGWFYSASLLLIGPTIISLFYLFWKLFLESTPQRGPFYSVYLILLSFYCVFSIHILIITNRVRKKYSENTITKSNHQHSLRKEMGK